MSILLDAGPALNFLAVGQENVLIQLARSRALDLSTPQRVYDEVLGMAKDPRFKQTKVLRTWKTLNDTGRLTVLSDVLKTQPQAFVDAVSRISAMPAEDRVRVRRSLGEIMVLAHASVFAQQGQDVFVLIDEGDGRARAGKEQQWVARNGHRGRLVLWSTPLVLKVAARESGWIRGD